MNNTKSTTARKKRRGSAGRNDGQLLLQVQYNVPRIYAKQVIPLPSIGIVYNNILVDRGRKTYSY